MSYSLADAIQDVLTDLWDHQDLLDAIESESPQEHITPGWPADEQDHPVVVRVQPITETSSSQREFSTIQRQYRFQFSVVSTLNWREWHENNGRYPQYEMASIMGHIADRMDVAADADELLPDGTASSTWQEVAGDRLALIQDWQTTAYTR